jgi:hypothetical protein
VNGDEVPKNVFNTLLTKLMVTGVKGNPNRIAKKSQLYRGRQTFHYCGHHLNNPTNYSDPGFSSFHLSEHS